MDTDPRRHEVLPDPVIRWLLAGDPAIRWQVLRHLTDAPDRTVEVERARVAREGWGAQSLAAQAPDGHWGGAPWNRGWDSTMHVLWLLWQFGLDPTSDACRRAVRRVDDGVTWRGAGPPECDHHSFFEGELEPCINAQVAAAGAGLDQDVGSLGGDWTRFAVPTWWHYDVLRGLDYLRDAGVEPDERIADAVELVVSRRGDDGRWPLGVRFPGTMPVEMDEHVGEPSCWITLRALRVLRWYAGRG